jgi:tetratricopeptide (TPR) repeat protein
MKFLNFLIPILSISIPYFLFSILLVNATVQVSTGTIFQENLNKLKEGDYKRAMLGFMDIVLIDPNNAMAVEYLKKAGTLSINEETFRLQKEYKETIGQARSVKEKLNQLKKVKTKRLNKWNKLFSNTCNLAGNPDTIMVALRSYEDFLNKTPVYSDGRKEFQKYVQEIKKNLYQTLKSKYPVWVGTPKTVDERDLATVFFARETASDFSYRYVYSGTVQEILDTAYKIKFIENKILSLFQVAEESFEFYMRTRYEKSIKSWTEVIRFDLNNEEALFYVDLAKKRLGIQEEPDMTDKFTEFHFQNILLPGESQGTTNIKTESTDSIEKPLKKPKLVRKKKPQLPKISTDRTRTEQSEDSGKESRLKQAEKLYEKGVQEFSVGNYEGAKISWEKCLKLNPKHLKAKVGIERIKNM